MEVITDRLEILYHALSKGKGRIGLCQRFEYPQHLVSDLKQYALHLVFDLEASRREQKELLKEANEYGINVEFHNKRDLRKCRVSQKTIDGYRDILTGNLGGLVDILRIYTTIKGKSPIGQYLEVIGDKKGEIKTPGEFLDFLTICTRYLRFDVNATKVENEYLQVKLRGY